MDWPRFRWGRLREVAEYEPATDARLAEEEPARGECVDPERQKRIRLRRGLFVLCLGTLFLAGSLVALVGRGGYVDLHRKREEARKLREEVATLRVNVGVLDHVVGRLEAEPLERERIAREQLGLVLPGEIDFLLPLEAAGGALRHSSTRRNQGRAAPPINAGQAAAARQNQALAPLLNTQHALLYWPGVGPRGSHEKQI